MKLDTRKDIENRVDIELLVNKFYQQARQDQLIGPIFNQTIGKHWAEHLQKIYTFWESRLLNADTYQGNPLKVHKPLPIAAEHFDRWLKLWGETVDGNFVGEVAELAKRMAKSIASFFLEKLTEMREEK